MEHSDTPLSDIDTFIVISFVDDAGCSRNSNKATLADVHLAAPEHYEGVFPHRDRRYFHRFGLTGEHGLRIDFSTSLGTTTTGAPRGADLVSTLTLSPKKIGKLVAAARKAGDAPTEARYPGFVYIARAGRSECASILVHLVQVKRVVCVRAVVVHLPAEDARYAAAKIKQWRAQ